MHSSSVHISTTHIAAPYKRFGSPLSLVMRSRREGVIGLVCTRFWRVENPPRNGRALHCESSEKHSINGCALSVGAISKQSQLEASSTRVLYMWAVAVALLTGYVIGRHHPCNDGFYWDNTSFFRCHDGSASVIACFRTPNGTATSGGTQVNGGGGRLSVSYSCACLYVCVHPNVQATSTWMGYWQSEFGGVYEGSNPDQAAID
eukprot:1505949-Amphidinium_carterae.1